MKKIALTIAAAAGASLSAFAQGQVGFANANANGYVIESSAPESSAVAGSTYIQASDFTAQLWALTTASTTVPGAVDAYGYVLPTSLSTLGFAVVPNATILGGSVGTAGYAQANQQADGYFSLGPNAIIPNTVSQSTVLAVVCWSGEWANLATAIANNAYVGDLVFVNPVGPASPTPYTSDISTGWNALENSPQSAAQGGNEDLVMSVVPEPTSLALAGLGGFGMLMALRRKQA